MWGEDRARAIARMRRALDEYQVRGIETNLAFHRRCLRHAAFVAGDYDTGFIGRNAAELAPRADDAELVAVIAAAATRRGDQARIAGRVGVGLGGRGKRRGVDRDLGLAPRAVAGRRFVRFVRRSDVRCPMVGQAGR